MENQMNTKNNIEFEANGYTALISVHIPFTSLEEYKSDYKSVAKSTAIRTRTNIEYSELLDLNRIQFRIFGKWRDCLQAGRHLWYHLIRETTVYAHSGWDIQLDQPLNDQNGKTLRQLYKSVTYRSNNDFNILSISGPCWDVLKVRKELIRRKSTQTYVKQSMNAKKEINALQILKCIGADIHDDINTPDSIYTLKNSQLIELLTGPNNSILNDKINDIDQSLSKQMYENRINNLENELEDVYKHFLEVNDQRIALEEEVKKMKSVLKENTIPEFYSVSRLKNFDCFKTNVSQMNDSIDSIEKISNDEFIFTEHNYPKLDFTSVDHNSPNVLVKSDKCLSEIEREAQEVNASQPIHKKREYCLISERISQLIGDHKQYGIENSISNGNENDSALKIKQNSLTTNVTELKTETNWSKNLMNFSKNQVISLRKPFKNNQT